MFLVLLLNILVLDHKALKLLAIRRRHTLPLHALRNLPLPNKVPLERHILFHSEFGVFHYVRAPILLTALGAEPRISQILASHLARSCSPCFTYLDPSLTSAYYKHSRGGENKSALICVATAWSQQ